MKPDPLLTARILWFAILSATILFLFIPMPPSDPVAGASLLLPLTIAAAGCAVGSIVAPAHLLRNGLTRLKLQTVEIEDRERAFGSIVPKRRAFRDPDVAESAAYRVYQTATIIGLALAEAVALDGFVLKFLAAGMKNALPFFIVSWALILVLFPRRSVISRALERAYGIGPIG
jgi:hypothetical protein